MTTSRKCKDWLDAYIEFTEDFESPPLFNKWIALLTLSVAAGRQIWLAEANNQVWPNLYVVLVGPSGIGKGIAMREALPFIELTGIPRSPDQVTIQQVVVDMSEKFTLSEAEGKITPYLLWAEELPSFLGMDAWKTGKLVDLTTLYDCAPSWRSETKNRGKFEIIKPYLCMLGGSTPSGLYDVLPPASVGQGFTSRIIFAWAGDYTKRVPVKPWTEKHQTLFDALKHDIEIISHINGPMQLSDVATVLWSDYYRYRPDPLEVFTDQRLQGFASRMPFYVKKLSVLCRMSDPEPGMIIEAYHLERAIQIIDEQSKILHNVYEDIAPSTIVRFYPKVIRAMLTLGGVNVPHSELMQKFSHDLDRREFKEVVGGLVDMGVMIENPQIIHGGRIKMFYSITKKKMAEKLI